MVTQLLKLELVFPEPLLETVREQLEAAGAPFDTIYAPKGGRGPRSGETQASGLGSLDTLHLITLCEIRVLDELRAFLEDMVEKYGALVYYQVVDCLQPQAHRVA